MSQATLEQTAKGGWKLTGVLDFASVPEVWPALERLLKTNRRLSVSLGGVVQTNSAGLVLLVEARDLARRSHCKLQLIDLPAELLDLARMSRCEGLIAKNAA